MHQAHICGRFLTRLQLLQISGSRMFMLRIKTLLVRDRHWGRKHCRERTAWRCPAQRLYVKTLLVRDRHWRRKHCRERTAWRCPAQRRSAAAIGAPPVPLLPSQPARQDVVSCANEPQLRVRDFCLSLSDLSELRRALNFPRRACQLEKRTGRRIRNDENSLHAAGICSSFLNPFLEFFLSTPAFSSIV